MAIRVSKTRSSVDVYLLIRRTLKARINKPMFFGEQRAMVSLCVEQARLKMRSCFFRREEQDREVTHWRGGPRYSTTIRGEVSSRI